MDELKKTTAQEGINNFHTSNPVWYLKKVMACPCEKFFYLCEKDMLTVEKLIGWMMEGD